MYAPSQCCRLSREASVRWNESLPDYNKGDHEYEI